MFTDVILFVKIWLTVTSKKMIFLWKEISTGHFKHLFVIFVTLLAEVVHVMKSNLHLQDCVSTEQDNIIHSIVQCNKSNINVIHRRVCNKTFYITIFL